MLELKLKLKVEGKGTGKGKGKADAKAEGIPGTTIAFTFGQGICIRWCDDVIETKHLIINYNRKTDETSDRTNEQATRPNCRPIFQKNDPVRPRCGPGAETGPAQSSSSNKKRACKNKFPRSEAAFVVVVVVARPHIRRNLGNVLTAPSKDCAKKFNTLPKIFCGFLATPPKTKVFLFLFFFFLLQVLFLLFLWLISLWFWFWVPHIISWLSQLIGFTSVVRDDVTRPPDRNTHTYVYVWDTPKIDRYQVVSAHNYSIYWCVKCDIALLLLSIIFCDFNE